MLLGATVASAQTAPPLPAVELERYEDAPMFIGRRDFSPAMISRHGVFNSYQANVDSSGQNITGDAANEPSIAVDPTNPNKMTIGWRQFDSVFSNFRQGGWGYTSNGGVSWTFPGVLENNVFRSDPVLASDDTGRFFYLSLLSNLFDDMWRSLNGGQSWTRLAPRRAETSNGSRSITRTAAGTGSSTRAGARPAIITAPGNSPVPSMAASPG